MRGTFTTTKYDDRRAYIERRPSGLVVAHNAFVAVGLEWMWKVMTGGLRNADGGMSDHLGKARLIVGNGSAPVTPGDERLAGADTAYAELDEGFPAVDGNAVRFHATFTEDAANFDWLERGVTSVQGVLIDRSVADQGRKAPGTVWTLEAVLEIGAVAA